VDDLIKYGGLASVILRPRFVGETILRVFLFRDDEETSTLLVEQDLKLHAGDYKHFVFHATDLVE
jgi:hypothetical protein